MILKLGGPKVALATFFVYFAMMLVFTQLTKQIWGAAEWKVCIGVGVGSGFAAWIVQTIKASGKPISAGRE